MQFFIYTIIIGDEKARDFVLMILVVQGTLHYSSKSREFNRSPTKPSGEPLLDDVSYQKEVWVGWANQSRRMKSALSHQWVRSNDGTLIIDAVCSYIYRIFFAIPISSMLQ